MRIKINVNNNNDDNNVQVIIIFTWLYWLNKMKGGNN